MLTDGLSNALYGLEATLQTAIRSEKLRILQKTVLLETLKLTTGNAAYRADQAIQDKTRDALTSILGEFFPSSYNT
jgi:hypothetical protein